MKKNLPEIFGITEISKKLVEIEDVRNVIWEYVGEENLKKTLKKIKEGTLESFQGEVIYGLIEDCIHEGREEVGSFGIHSNGIEHQIEIIIYKYYGIYFIEGMYLDPTGYFYSRDAAISFGRHHWIKDKKTQDWREDL